MKVIRSWIRSWHDASRVEQVTQGVRKRTWEFGGMWKRVKEVSGSDVIGCQHMREFECSGCYYIIIITIFYQGKHDLSCLKNNLEKYDELYRRNNY